MGAELSKALEEAVAQRPKPRTAATAATPPPTTAAATTTPPPTTAATTATAATPPPTTAAATTTPPGGTTTSTAAASAAAAAAAATKAADQKKAAEIKTAEEKKSMESFEFSLFVGIFFTVLSVVVLITTGSIVSVLVLWAVIALIVAVLLYYDIIDLTKQESEFVPDIPAPLETEAHLNIDSGYEVFHIRDRKFTYDESAAVCAAYDARLATLEQITEAWENGAEWCGYGWSAGGMALYPTQLSTWKLLQEELDNGKRTRCGRPGINGGYFDPSIKFGVNCYGFKPKGKFTPGGLPGSDPTEFDKMVEKFRKMMKAFTLHSYSRKEWSENDSWKPNSIFATTKRSATGQIERFGNGVNMDYGRQFVQDFGQLYETFTEHNTNAEPPGPAAATGAVTTAWIANAPYGLRGDKGDKGDTGAKGDKGDTGAAGARGAPGTNTGIVGPAGPRGTPGTPGTQGVKGSTGPAGPAGAQGPKGDQGVAGPAGPAGSGGGGTVGPRGLQGIQGERGLQGIPGVVGGVGPVGPVGPAGTYGPVGPVGPVGPRGPEGPKGLTGPGGAKGDTGAPGPAGVWPKNAVFDTITIGKKWVLYPWSGASNNEEALVFQHKDGGRNRTAMWQNNNRDI